MSTEPGKQDSPVNAPTLNATGEFEAPAATPNAAEQTLNATGEFLPGDGGSPPIELPRDATTVLPPSQLVDNTSKTTGGAPDLGSTRDDSPDAFGATGVYEPGSTQAPANQSTLNRGAPALEGTGVYVPGATGGHGGFDPGATAALFHFSGEVDSTNPGDTLSKGSGKAPPSLEKIHAGRYVMKRFHAKGGMGEIWLAEDPRIGRSVALKRMLSHRPDQQRRFMVEAQVTGQLEHPGIVPVHEVGADEQGQPYYVMKFVRGRTLQTVIDEYHAAKGSAGGSEVEQFRLLNIFISLCQTVAYAHSKGVLHRDLKPENVMLGSYGETLLLDWGIAKVIGQPETPTAPEDQYVQLNNDAADTETRAGAILGSLAYMAPESAAGANHELDQRSDVFLLGGILYTILTGRPPREGATALDMIKKAQRETQTSVRKVAPHIPKALEAICVKALALRKDDRYQTALALAEDVQRYAAGEPVSAYREGFAERAWRWAKRHRTALTRTALTVLFLGVVAAGAYQYRELTNQWAEERRQAREREDKLIRDQAEETRLAKEREDKLKQEAAFKQRMEDAQADLKTFQTLADEARYYAATTDPVAENAPYFDPLLGEKKATEALAVAAKWRADFKDLPLREDEASVKKESYDQYLLVAQSKLQRGTDAETAKESLALLDQAKEMSDAPSRGYYRLRALANKRLAKEKEAAEDEQLAEAKNTPLTSMDHFLRGEQLRKDSTGRKDEKGERKAWQPEPERMEMAIKAYKEALRVEPKHYWSLFQLGRCYLSLGRDLQAIETLGACVALNPDAPWGYSVRGVAYSQMKDYDNAELDLNKVLDKDADLRPARLNRGVVYWKQKKNKEALDDFADVLAPPNEKRLFEAALYRGQLYLQEGKVAEALEDFNLVAKENPRLRPVYLYRAQIHLAQGKSVRAVEDLQKYLAFQYDFKPDRWEAHARVGRQLRDLYVERTAEKRQDAMGKAIAALALSELNEALKKGGKVVTVFDDLSAMLEFTGRAKESLAACTLGLDIAPDSAKLLTRRGWLHDALGEGEKATADFAAAVRADPEHAEAHTGLGYMRAVQKVLPEAQREADLALLHGSDKYLVLHNVACIYAVLSQADPKQAVAFEDVAMALIRREVKLWQREGTGLNAIDLIKGESAFKPLHKRPDFIAIITGSR